MARIVPIDVNHGNNGRRPSASWSSGKEIVGTDGLFRGWFLDVGSDAALDEAAEAANWRRGGLVHLDGEVREHWLAPSPLVLFVLIDGVPYRRLLGLASNDVSASGIACRWVKGQRSRLAVMALPRDLLAHGYRAPIAFHASSTSTDDLLTALLHHNDVLDAMEAAAAEAGRPRQFDFWALGLPLVPGPKVGRGSGSQTTQISPIASGHPTAPDRDALRALLQPAANLVAPVAVAEIRRQRWPEIVAWAASARQGTPRAEAEPRAEAVGR